MTVIAAAIISRQGKIILSRQFTDISRIRIEGLLSAFPKLLGSGGRKQCTYIETGSVRYVYQPIENLLLVLVTTKNSNIVEDLSTLHMMGGLIPEVVNTIDEDTLSQKAFEVLFAFDEVIVGGNRENNTMEQVLTYLEMQSHEEDVAKEEKRQQMELARKEARRRATELTQKRREMGGYGGVGSDGRGHEGSAAAHFQPTQEQSAPSRFSSVVEETPTQPKKSVGGMSLGRARKADISSKILQEDGVVPVVAPAPQSVAPTQASCDADGIHVKIEEKISAVLNKDGGAANVDVRGELFITINDPQLCSVRVLVGRMNDDFNFKTHPNINKMIFQSDRVLAIKDNKPYPPHQTLGILKWRLQNAGRVRAPISVTCWPGDNSATIEYELENLQATLTDVVIVVPLGGVGLADAETNIGDFQVRGGDLHWRIPSIDSSCATGSFDVTLRGNATDSSFFPMQVHFNAVACIAGVAVTEITGTETGIPVRFSKDVILSAENYLVS